METNLRSLSKLESKVVLTLREMSFTHVLTKDVRSILGPAASESTVRKVIQNLVRKGWFVRITGGKFVFLPPENGPQNLGENNVLSLATAVVQPCYVGWWSAASWHGFTTQKPMRVFVAVTKQTPGRVLEGHEIQFVTVVARKFFGFEFSSIYGRSVPLSTPAKTLVDCLDRPDLSGGPTELTRITHSALGMVDGEELLRIVQAVKSKAICQRLGFLADLVGRALPGPIRAALRHQIPATYRSHFGRPEPCPGDVGYVAEWGLIVHSREDELLAEVPRKRTGGEHARPE